MQQITDSNSGIYILELYARDEFQIPVKKFRNSTIKKGYYYYIGSAQKNLQQRIDRHFRTAKKVHWHIDYLTTNRNVVIKTAYVITDAPKNLEEKIANIFPSAFDGKIMLKGFGNSDTKGTLTHLFYRSRKIPYSHFSERYQSIVSLSPSSNE